MTLVETVACALVESRYVGALPFFNLTPREQKWFLDDARAAIKAYEGYVGE